MSDFFDRRKAVGLGVAVVAAGAVAWLAKDALRPPEVGAPKLAVPAARQSFPPGPLLVQVRGGAPRDLAAKTGKGLILHFWATWCAPCREEMPEFIKAQTEYGPKGLQFVGIAVDQADKIDQFAKEIGLNYPALVGGFGAMELSKTLGNSLMALPFTVVLDRKGEIVHTQLGNLKPDKLQSLVKQLL